MWFHPTAGATRAEEPERVSGRPSLFGTSACRTLRSRGSAMCMHTASYCNGSMTARHCASSSLYVATPTRVVACSFPALSRRRQKQARRLQVAAYGVEVPQAIITQSSGSASARKAVWLLQLLRPSLRRAVTASVFLGTAAAAQVTCCTPDGIGFL